MVLKRTQEKTKHYTFCSEDPKTHRSRNGVELEDIKNALMNGKPKHRSDSLRYLGDKCSVSVNRKTGLLIQTNPKKGMISNGI